MSTNLIYIVSVLIFCIFPKNPDHFRDQTTWTMWFLLAAISWELAKKIHWSVALMFLLTTISANNISYAVQSPFQYLGQFNVIAMDGVTAQSLAWSLTIGLSLLFLPSGIMIEGFGIIGLISSVMMIYNFLTKSVPVGILDNPAIDATLIAIILPSMFHKYKWFLVLPIISIIISKSNTGLMLLGFQILCYLWATQRINRTLMIEVICCFGGVTGLYKLFMGWKFLDDSGRYVIWRWAWEYFLNSKQYLFGLGSGTFQLLGPTMQKEHNHIAYFIWMHNEFLQVLFEQGIIGLSISLIAFGFMWKTAQKPWLKACLGTIFLACFTQFPFRMLPSCLFCAMILKEVYKDHASGRAFMEGYFGKSTLKYLLSLSRRKTSN